MSSLGSPDGRFWPDRVRQSVSQSRFLAHRLPQGSEGKERLWTWVNHLKSQETDPLPK